MPVRTGAVKKRVGEGTGELLKTHVRELRMPSSSIKCQPSLIFLSLRSYADNVNMSPDAGFTCKPTGTTYKHVDDSPFEMLDR